MALLLCAGAAASACRPGGRTEYVGGTLASLAGGKRGCLYTIDPASLVFSSRHATLRFPYSRVNLIEYGQKVDRRYLMGVLISPLLILSKKRKHFLTVGYSDEQGRQQAIVLRVDKSDIRAVLAGLEARTGLRVQYQDEEARKAGKG